MKKLRVILLMTVPSIFAQESRWAKIGGSTHSFVGVGHVRDHDDAKGAVFEVDFYHDRMQLLICEMPPASIVALDSHTNLQPFRVTRTSNGKPRYDEYVLATASKEKGWRALAMLGKVIKVTYLLYGERITMNVTIPEGSREINALADELRK